MVGSTPPPEQATADVSQAARPGTRGPGLHKVIPKDDTTNTTIDIIAIHGLGTESPRTWVFKREDGDMLPATVPEARIFTYNWDANYFEDAPVESLRGNADSLLALVNENRSSENRSSETQPLIFVASCFGGLVLAEALIRANQATSPYRHVLLATVGIVFLATPFRGSDAAREARWQVVVGGIMGNETSTQLVDALNHGDRELRNITKSFAEFAHAASVRLPVHCLYERRKTEILRRILSPGWASRFSIKSTHKILVSQSSACLDSFPSHGLDATHSGMNKFVGPEDVGFKQVKGIILEFLKNAPSVIIRRQRILYRLSPRGGRRICTQSRLWVVPLERNRSFVGREPILQQLLERAAPTTNTMHVRR